MALVRLIEALRAAGLNHAAHESVADLLFLAQHWNLFTATPQSTPQAPPPAAIPPPPNPDPQPPPKTTPSPTDSKPNPHPTAKGIFAADTAPGLDGAPATRIGVPDPAALPNPLLVARALRPLARRLASHHDTEFDEEATAEQSARDRHLSLVFRPVRERWFDLLLLVEDTISMAVWQRALAEFTALLGSHGAFRDVRRARFRATAETVETGLAPIRRISPGLASHRPVRAICLSHALESSQE